MASWFPSQIISPDVGLPSDPTSPHPRQQQDEQVAEEGEYSNQYDTLRPIGKGAFGFVRMAQRKDDGTAVRENVHKYTV